MTKNIAFTLFFLFTFLANTYAFVVTGRVTSDFNLKKPVTIYFKTDDELFKTYSDDTGYFNMELKEGLYFVTAELTLEGKVYKGVSGRNPLLLNKDEHIGIKLFPLGKIKVKKIKSETPVIECRLIYENKPLKDGRVYFYLKQTDIKGMPYYYSQPTDRNGKVRVKEVLEGNYYIVAKKKSDDTPLGPVFEGDLIGFFSESPYYFKSGHHYSFDIHLIKKVRDEVPPVLTGKEMFYIKGKVVNEKGDPIAGLYAFAYDKKIIGHERPVSLSNRTDKNGIFILPVPGKGRYYIGVREFYGGTPVQGEYYGLYGGTYDHHIDVEDNLENVTILVEKILK